MQKEKEFIKLLAAGPSRGAAGLVKRASALAEFHTIQLKLPPEAFSEPHHSSGSDLSDFCSKVLRVVAHALWINLAEVAGGTVGRGG